MLAQNVRAQRGQRRRRVVVGEEEPGDQDPVLVERQEGFECGVLAIDLVGFELRWRLFVTGHVGGPSLVHPRLVFDRNSGLPGTTGMTWHFLLG